MEKKEKKKIEKREIEIPEGVEIKVDGNKILVKGEKGELEREIRSEIKVSKEGNKITLTSASNRRRVKALLGTSSADMKNMIDGVKGGVVYKLKVVYSHFPVNLKVQGDTLWIENFLGEKYPRKAKILEGVSVDIKGQEIEVRGIDQERVGQTAANIEQATRIKRRDRRVFQDGCYIYDKDGKSMLR